jgi:hypothetical protein
MTRLYVSMGFYPVEYFRATVDYIARTQTADGAIPWFEDGLMDPWDHIESAMGLTIGGCFDEAKQAYYWMRDNQLPNGSWLASYRAGKVEDGTRAESNFVAYIATGVWHYYLVTQDRAFLEGMWPVVNRAIAFVLSLQGPKGEIYWAEDTTKGIQQDSLITGCSSIYKSLECAINIATTLNLQVPHWALARTRLGRALRQHPECFDRTWDSKSRFAMDWFYPVLTGVVHGQRAQQHLKSRWQQFVVQLFSWLHEFRDTDGAYWTGYVFRDDTIWPAEKPTWTAAAILLAADALSNATPAAHLFRQESTVVASQDTQRANYSKILE